MPFEWPNYTKLVGLITKIMISEGKGRGLKVNLKDEPPVEELKGSLMVTSLPNTVLRLLGKVLFLAGEDRLAT